MEKYGIKETKEALALVFASLRAWDMANADGKLDLNDLAQLVPIFPVAGPAIENIGDIPKEFVDLNNEEGAELVAYAGLQLAGLADAQVVEVVGAALQVVVAVGALLKVINAMKQQVADFEIKPVPAVGA